MTKEEFEEMDIDELRNLRNRIDLRIYEKAIMQGYKDGFREGQKSEKDKHLLMNAE